jgi:hypothetical protein
MTTCHCDGPPHPYDPSWCIRPRFDVEPSRPLPAGATIVGLEGAYAIVAVPLAASCPGCGHLASQHGPNGCLEWVGTACTSPCSCSIRTVRSRP